MNKLLHVALLSSLAVLLMAISTFSFSVPETVAQEMQTSTSERIESAAAAISSILNRVGMKMSQFITILAPYQDRFIPDSPQDQLVNTLQNEVLDAFYSIDNFSSCTQYNDGCNSCAVTSDFDLTGCTERQCLWQGVPSCESYETPSLEYVEVQEALDSARDTRSMLSGGDYSAVQTLSCFCTEEYRRPIAFDVVGFEVVIESAEGVTETGPVPYDEANGPRLYTVNQLFDLIQDAIDEQAASITVTYDQTGYPSQISIDYNEMIADEELYYSYEVTTNNFVEG